MGKVLHYQGLNLEMKTYKESSLSDFLCKQLAGNCKLTASAATWLCLAVKDKCIVSPCRALRRGPRLSQWQLNSFLIKGELVRLSCNLMQIWSRNDSQWIINEDEAAEQKPCNSSRGSVMNSFTPDNSRRQDWIYSFSKLLRPREQSTSSRDKSTTCSDCQAYTCLKFTIIIPY